MRTVDALNKKEDILKKEAEKMLADINDLEQSNSTTEIVEKVEKIIEKKSKTVGTYHGLIGTLTS